MRFLLVAAGLLSLCWAEPAFACSCATGVVDTNTYRQWLDRFDGAVFRGAVIKTEEQAGFSKVTFRVERYWKGVTASEVVIYTPRQGSMCGVSFLVGQTHTVAAQRDNDRLQTDLCIERFIAQNATRFREAIGAGTSASSPPR